MDSLLIAMAASFLVGMLGYIIAYFWVRPIGQYQRQKHSLKSELDYFESLLDRHDSKTWQETAAKDRLKSARQALTKMTEVYATELPYWYKLVLGRRGETPLNATAAILALANIRHAEHARIRLAQVRKALLLS